MNQRRAAHLELDKIEAARKERAKASLSLKKLTATMRRVQEGRGPTRGGAESGRGRGRERGQQEAPGGFLSNYNLGGKVPNPNGVLTGDEQQQQPFIFCNPCTQH
jgi:hypothetical protein